MANFIPIIKRQDGVSLLHYSAPLHPQNFISSLRNDTAAERTTVVCYEKAEMVILSMFPPREVAKNV